MVTIDPERRIVEDGAVAIEGGRIVAVGTAEELGQRYQARETIDCAREAGWRLVDVRDGIGLSHSLLRFEAA